uniref:Uncharacterized protein n=1 Tax=Avena sativa TaxID=4498 RepID=A0ACD5XN49_AVESA
MRLHLPRCFCELPLVPFPPGTPPYPNRDQFIAYLDAYARAFAVEPLLGARVRAAAYDAAIGFWRVTVDLSSGEDAVTSTTEFVSRWLVVATGENAEPVWPEGVEGMDVYRGPVMHTSTYKRGDEFAGKKVLVVGCGNSGMEVSLDLCNNGAKASMVVRDKLHVLPRDILGISTFGLSVFLLKWLPIKWVDTLFLLFSRLILGDTAKYGLQRPKIGPLQLKKSTGKTPVLDIGALRKIRDGEIKEDEFFSQSDGFPMKTFPHSWRGKNGLYATGFTRRGLMGSSYDASRIAADIANQWTEALARNIVAHNDA